MMRGDQNIGRSMELPACPHNVQQRALILHMNGVTGFNGPTTERRKANHFALCVYHDASLEERIDELRRESGARTLECDAFVNSNNLEVHWSEYALRYDVFNALMRMGYSFQTATWGQPNFEPGDAPFTRALLERRCIEQARGLLGYRLVNMISHACCEEWNFETPEGKAFARELRNSKAMRHRYDATRENFYAWPIFARYDPMTLCDLPPLPLVQPQPVVIVLSDDEESDSGDDAPEVVDERVVCCVCLDARADTLVLPCMHQIVCGACSHAIAKRDRTMRCVVCQTPLTEVCYSDGTIMRYDMERK